MTYLPFTLTFMEPEIIAPASALSPTRPQGIPPILTVGDPWFKLAMCDEQGGIIGGTRCVTVGVPRTAQTMPFALTVLLRLIAKLVIPSHAWP